ncbi:hypothetical protein AAHC03_05334 [Spirometra sp. Aus1]
MKLIGRRARLKVGRMDCIKIPKVDSVTYVDRFNGYVRAEGVLHITVTHIFFIDRSGRYEVWMQTFLIGSVERLPLTATGAPLVIRGKDFRVACFLVSRDRDCQDVYETLLRLTQIVTINDLSCFRYLPPSLPMERGEGWDFHPLKDDFDRMGLPNVAWKATNQNHSYQLCDTYPSILFVPATASTPTIIGSSKFRSRGRLPVLTYLHPNKKAALCRSSQPLSGFSSRSHEDQAFLRHIRDANPLQQVLHVVDTRPHLNALTNRAQGKGYEDIQAYKGIDLRFFDIPNIHAIRSSLEKLIKAYHDPRISVEDLNVAIDKSSWLRSNRKILEASFYVAQRLEAGYSVLVHCSDGWDRTAQVCSLAQLIIDPFYRTIDGIQKLIEKDWLHFGHKFTDRSGLLSTGDSRECAPVFTQFLDCLRHLLDLLPTKFEFSQRLLLELHDQHRSALYGTFVGCCEKDRIDLRLSERTCSFWAYLNRNREYFLNPLYQREFSKGCDSPTRNTHQSDMLPSFVLSPQLFRVWRELFLRREWRMPIIPTVFEDSIKDLTVQTRAYAAHADLLRVRIQQLCALLGKPPEVIDQLLASTVDHHCTNNPGARNGESCLVNCNGSAGGAALTTAKEALGMSDSLPNGCDSDLTKHPGATLPPLSVSALALQLAALPSEPEPLAVHPSASCPICNVLMVIHSPKAHCSRCGRLICSRCYERRSGTLDDIGAANVETFVCKHCCPKAAPPCSV